MVIRKISEEDISCVAEMERSIFGSHISDENFRKDALNPDNVYLVAVDGDEIAGYCGFIVSYENADLCNIAVLDKYRRRHLADDMLKKAFDICADMGVESILLEVRPSNAGAISLYRKNDFKEISVRNNYYINPTENALIMQKEL